jgi:dTDP-4-dehydrorhamnose reductase
MTASASPSAGFKVAVIGASGLLGRAIAAEVAQQRDWTMVGTGLSRTGLGSVESSRMAPSRGMRELVPLDIRDPAAVEQFFSEQRPDAVILAAAERRPDVCEKQPQRARAINVEAVRSLGLAAARRGAWLLNVSTDYVFDGSRAPYGEADTPAPLNAYGRSKLEGEQALWSVTDQGCVLRLPLLYGPSVDWQESAVTSLVPAIAASARPNAAPALIDDWAIRYPTYTPDIAIVIRQLLERHAQRATVCGTFHWSGTEALTKYGIALKLAAALRLDTAGIVAQAAPADSTPRPYDCHLDATRLETLGIGTRTPFDAGLSTVLAGLTL